MNYLDYHIQQGKKDNYIFNQIYKTINIDFINSLFPNQQIITTNLKELNDFPNIKFCGYLSNNEEIFQKISLIKNVQYPIYKILTKSYIIDNIPSILGIHFSYIISNKNKDSLKEAFSFYSEDNNLSFDEEEKIIDYTRFNRVIFIPCINYKLYYKETALDKILVKESLTYDFLNISYEEGENY